MELIIQEYKKTEPIQFNYEEIKLDIQEAVKQYTNIAYTDDQMKEAKTDRAKLRKFADVLDKARKQVKADCLAPYTVFEAQIKELLALIEEPVRMIDTQIKEYEDKLRLDKEKEIVDYYKSIEHPEKMYLARIWDDRWLNATYSMKKIQEEIAAGIERWNTEMAVIERLNNPVPARMVYIETMDLNKAVAESDKQDEIARLKAEAEAQKEAEPLAGNMNPPEPEQPIVQNDQKETSAERQWVGFRALLTVEEALKLRDYLEDNNITFEPIVIGL